MGRRSRKIARAALPYISRVLITLSAALFLVACSKHSSQDVQGYVEGKYIDLSSSGSGKITKLTVSSGDRVKAGQLLFQLDPNPEFAELQQAKSQLVAEQENLNNLELGRREPIIKGILAQLAQAEADLQLAKLTLARNKKLLATGAVGQAAYDASLTTFRRDSQRVVQLQANLAEAKLGGREHKLLAQQADIAAAKANVERLSWQLSQKTVNSPKAGIIFDTYYKAGEYVPAGQPVASLLTADNVELLFFVPEKMLSQLKLGQPVQFSCDGCNGKQTATIRFISPSAEYTPPVIYSETSRQKLVYRIEAVIPVNKALQFHPGQPVDVTIK